MSSARTNQKIHFAFIILLGIVVYSNTLSVPFQWDEPFFMGKNPVVKDLSYFLEPSKAKASIYYGSLKNRYVGYLTFALNYKLNGLDVKGYHIVNLAIHIMNALLVYLLVKLSFRTPFLMGSALAARSKLIAFVSASLFIAHPLQTEAVTYIFQRLASFVALFYLLSLVCYIKYRVQTPDKRTHWWLVCAVLSAVLAMKTKENAFTLPFVAALFEFSFFRGHLKERMLSLLPVLLTALIVPLSVFVADGPEVNPVVVPGTAKVGLVVPGADYLFTQFRVIVTYIRLLFLPVNQNLDYDYILSRSFFEPAVLLSFLFLFSIIALGIYLFYRSGKKDHAYRFIAFGIFWFFMTISVESSIIPIPMIICEYRVYLPSAMFFPAVTTAVFLVLDKIRDRKWETGTAALLLFLLLMLSCAAYARNEVWGSRISLWEDVIKKSPHKPGGHEILSSEYWETGQTDKAIEQALIVTKLRPDYPNAHFNLAVYYESKGLIDKAIEYMEAALKLKPGDAEARYNLAEYYKKEGSIDKAISELLIVLETRPYYAEAYNNLGVAYMAKGLNDKAREAFSAALKIRHDYVEPHYNLAQIYFRKGLVKKAREESEAALRINPGYIPAIQFLAYLDKKR